jgi:hypothetical protein
MDSRLLHKTTSFLKTKVSWNREAGNEWKHFGQDPLRRFDIVVVSLKEHINDEPYNLVRGRTNSCQLNIEELTESLHELAGYEDFEIWDAELKSVMEFKSMGIFRTGKVK